ncbi:type II toxin-antitoxin system RnlB family antitoxin [Pseudomonas shirazica]|uniref:type II toxin-antitoxin system RnlB family antitoxin n=1 Tax=Pseudomonas shirazica TaxID=1940636 RepID=UPI00398AD8DB
MFDIRRLETGAGVMTVVTATSYENPLSSLSIIAKEMRNSRHSSKEVVIFDLLCSNGEEWNRFASMSYNGTDFEKNTFNIISKSDIPADLVETQSHFFQTHPEYLLDSVMN